MTRWKPNVSVWVSFWGAIIPHDFKIISNNIDGVGQLCFKLIGCLQDIWGIGGRSATGVEQMSLWFIQIPEFILNL